LEIVVVDGVLDLATMKRTNISRLQLFANLRAANIKQLRLPRSQRHFQHL